MRASAGGVDMEELTGSVLADLRKIGTAIQQGRLPCPMPKPELMPELIRRYPSLSEALERSTTTLRNVKLTSVLGCSLPKEICDIMHFLEEWSQKTDADEKRDDASLIVDLYGNINVHTAMTVKQYRDSGVFNLCKCPFCTEFYSGA